MKKLERFNKLTTILRAITHVLLSVPLPLLSKKTVIDHLVKENRKACDILLAISSLEERYGDIYHNPNHIIHYKFIFLIVKYRIKFKLIIINSFRSQNIFLGVETSLNLENVIPRQKLED